MRVWVRAASGIGTPGANASVALRPRAFVDLALTPGQWAAAVSFQVPGMSSIFPSYAVLANIVLPSLLAGSALGSLVASITSPGRSYGWFRVRFRRWFDCHAC